MKKQMSNSLNKLSSITNRVAHKIYTQPTPLPEPLSEHDLMVDKWNNDHGDDILRLNYELNQDSTVFDMGGYQGQWATDIFTRYGCNLYIFEPMASFAAEIKKRFQHNKKVTVYEYGLADKDQRISLSMNENASSIYDDANHRVSAELKDAAEFLKTSKIDHIDLMKINIEGGEYDLLNRLIEIDYIKNIIDIQIQFHEFVPGASEKVSAIQKELSKTHILTYQYPFVWENWHRK